MSHVVTLATSIKNPEIAAKVAKKLGYEHQLAQRGSEVSIDLYSGAKATGRFWVKLPGWRFPVCVKEDGTCAMDNYGGSWGKQEEFDSFLQKYTAEMTTDHLRSRGYRMQQEKVEADGTQELVFVH